MNILVRFRLHPALLALFVAAIGSVAGNASAADGIKSLIYLTAMKADNAGDSPLERQASQKPRPRDTVTRGVQGSKLKSSVSKKESETKNGVIANIRG